MAAPSDPSIHDNPDAPRGIGAAALSGAASAQDNPGTPASVSQPGQQERQSKDSPEGADLHGGTERTGKAQVSYLNQVEEDTDQDWRRAGGAAPDSDDVEKSTKSS